MKNLYLLMLLLLFSCNLAAQMPTNNDYTNWNWENQNQDNWKRYDQSSVSWISIRPPFLSTTPLVGEMLNVFNTLDYKKVNGWVLLWAQFNQRSPYFILYNQNRGLVRTFFYNDNAPMQYFLATLSFHDIQNPAILAAGNEYTSATDQYLNNSRSQEDMISVIVPGLPREGWCSVDFPIMFDNNILNSRYNAKQWVFKFYMGSTYEIRCTGSKELISTKQHTLIGSRSSVLPDKIVATQSKLLYNLESTSKYLQDMKNSVSKIDGSSPKFLQTYKSKVSAINEIGSTVTPTVGISSGVGAILGYSQFLLGVLDGTSATSTSAIATGQYLQLEGSMKLEGFITGNTLKIPGVTNTYNIPFPNWAYNCPLGLISLQKTPTIKRTAPYTKYGCYDARFSKDTAFLVYNNGVNYGAEPLAINTPHKHKGGYEGRIVKYKFEDDLSFAFNSTQDLQLIDINVAIVCYPQKRNTNEFYYNIENKVLSYYEFVSYKNLYNIETENPVYNGLLEEKYIVHKFDKENKDVCFGTPFMPLNKLKGVVLEVPEHTDVKLRVVAKFSSSKYDKPIIFQSNYNLNVVETPGNPSQIYGWFEQPYYPFSDFYPSSGKLGNSFVLNTNENKVYMANEIFMEAGFNGSPGFEARSFSNLPELGSTRSSINPINFNCTAK